MTWDTAGQEHKETLISVVSTVSGLASPVIAYPKPD